MSYRDVGNLRSISEQVLFGNGSGVTRILFEVSIILLNTHNLIAACKPKF